MLKSTKTLNAPERNVPVDIFRAIAIIAVMLFHFNELLPYGYLGVELFFVISGLLVSGILIKTFNQNKPVNYFRFILQRGFKIWPSYYTLFLVGGVLAWVMYRNTDPDQIIPLWDLKRYLFFYKNYVSGAWHWSFDHIWSLCVEEHFYIMLPIMFIVAHRFFNRPKYLFLFTGIVILLGIVFKPMGLYLTNSHDTTAMTQYRLDALGWGVLLNLLITYFPERIKKYSTVLLATGLFIFCITLLIDIKMHSAGFHKVALPSLVPFSFFLMMGGAFFFKFTGLKFLRYIAYYSYNLYLWHVIFIKFITTQVGNNALGLLTYIACASISALIFTVLIEEKALSKRSLVLNRIFNVRNPVKPEAVQ